MALNHITIMGRLTRDPELLEKGAAVMRKKAAFIRKTELRPQEEPGWTNRSHQ